SYRPPSMDDRRPPPAHSVRPRSTVEPPPNVRKIPARRRAQELREPLASTVDDVAPGLVQDHLRMLAVLATRIRRCSWTASGRRNSANPLIHNGPRGQRGGGLEAGEALAGADDGHGVAVAGAAAEALDGAGNGDRGDDPAGAVADGGGDAG